MLTERAFRLADARDALAVEWDERLRRTRDECAALGGDPSSLRVVPDVSAGWFRLESATPAAVDGVAFHGFLIAEEAAYLSRLVGTDPEPPHPPSVVIPPAAFAPVSGGGHDAPAVALAIDGRPVVAFQYVTYPTGRVAVSVQVENGSEWGDHFLGSLWPADGDGWRYDPKTLNSRDVDPDIYDTREDAARALFAYCAPLSHSDADLVARQAARDAAADPFVAALALAAGTATHPVAPDAAAEVRRLVAAGDVFGAGLVMARDIGHPLKAMPADRCPRCHGTGYEHDGPRCIGCDGARVAPLPVSGGEHDGVHITLVEYGGVMDEPVLHASKAQAMAAVAAFQAEAGGEPGYANIMVMALSPDGASLTYDTYPNVADN